MPSPLTSSSSLFKDAVTVFLDSANHALSVAEEAHKADVTRALDTERDLQRQLGEMRQERDLALQEKFKAELGAERARCDAESWKAAASKAEWTIDHQAETIVLLRSESQQWKDQFLRVEEERCKLASRIDEMVAEQLQANRRTLYHKEPLTPRSQGPLSNGHTRSTSYNKRELSTAHAPTASSSSRSESSGYTSDHSGLMNTSAPTSEHASLSGEKPTPRPASNAVASTSQVRGSKRAYQVKKSGTGSIPATSTSRTSPKQVFVRRVHAVVEVPVKEEEMDTEHQLMKESSRWEPSTSVEHPRLGRVAEKQRSKQPVRKARSDGEGRRVSRRRVIEDEEDYADEDDNYVDSADERRTSVSRAAAGVSASYGDDEDDELMMGVEAEDDEVYGSERVLKPTDKRTAPRRANTQPSSSKYSSSSSKRRVGSPHPDSASKKARKK